MKKLVLVTLAVLMGVALFAQPLKISTNLLNKSAQTSFIKNADILPVGSQYVYAPAREINLAVNETIIGNTVYDAQTNSSLSNRIVMHPDGTIGATWTRGMEATTYPERGTGYNYFDGSAWGPAPTARIESVRCGWPSYATWGPTGEINIAHDGANGLYINKRDVRGTGAWTESFLPGPTGLADVTWPRLVTSSENFDIIHMLCANDAGFEGQSSVMFYSRSDDGGATWDPSYTVLDGTGSDYYNFISADEYTMVSKGDTVVILVADPWLDLFFLKSTDNGENWEKTVIWEHPYPLFDWEVTLTDTLFAVDYSADVAIGPDGKVHVAFGITRVLHAEIGTTFTYFPLYDGIGYWNEDMPPFSNNLSALAGPQYEYAGSEMIEDYNYIGWTQDVDGDGDITLLDDVMSYDALGLSCQPSIIVDDNNRVFVAWASTTETYHNTEFNYKKIWARAFENGEWGPFLHVTNDIVHIFDESVYPQLAEGSDDLLYLMYQADDAPGIALALPEPNHQPHENSVIVAEIDKTDLLTGVDDDHHLINAYRVSQNYPNPFTGNSTITVNLESNANLSMIVTNMLGQEVQTFERGSVQAGTYFFEVNGENLTEGVYFYTVKADNSSVTKKMVVR